APRRRARHDRDDGPRALRNRASAHRDRRARRHQEPRHARRRPRSGVRLHGGEHPVTRDPGPFLTAFLRLTALIARAHLVRTLRSRRFLACAIVAFLPALVAFLVTSTSTRAGPGHLATNLGWMILLQIVVPLVTLIAGSAVVAEEIEDRTITYLVSRPIPRAALLFGRWLATLAFLGVILSVATAALLYAAST